MTHTVLQVIPRLEAGGAERTTIDMARAVTSAGGRALIATAGGRMSKEAEEAGAEVFFGPFHSKNPMVIASNVRRLARIMNQERVDLLHARSRAPAWSGLFAARRAGAAFVTTHHGAYRSSGRMKRVYNGVMARGDRVIANCHYIGERLRTDHPAVADRLVVIPRGVDLARFDPLAVSAERRALVARYWGEGARPRDAERAYRILLPARITAWKGHDTLVEALIVWMKRGAPALDVVFAGDTHGRPDYFQRLRAKISSAGLDGVVRFAGHVVDAPAAYLWADVVVAPSTEPEAFGRTAVEAQAMGRIVIASDHGAARETVRHGETGLLARPGDARSLADLLARAYGMDQAEAARMALAARAHARAFSLDAMCARTLAVYEDVAP